MAGRSQWYIGAPNGVILCVDQAAGRSLRGRLYHSYSREAVTVSSLEQVLFEMEHLYDSLNFPHPADSSRTFQEKAHHTGHRAGRAKIMSDEELLKRHGDLGTFIIRVQHRQNSSWQGRITWMDEDKTVYFRSMWEMLKLIDSAVGTVSGEDESQGEPSWMDQDE